MKPARKCSHSSLTVSVSPHGGEAGYQRLDWARRVAGTTPSGRVSKDGPEQEPSIFASTFPAPLVLPGDELAWDPSHPPQSLRSWSSLKERNKITSNKKTVYVARPPCVSGGISSMREWTVPTVSGDTKGKGQAVLEKVQIPRFEDTLDFLRAFYHGFDVKEYTPSMQFEPWETSSNRKSRPSYVGLKKGPSDSCTRVRVRPSPDGLFSSQLNLDDLLDGAINALPEDAYALLLLVDHDLYEDEEDDFCCGRAYGGSRVAVVSSARYSPRLHAAHGVDPQHMWPASHCAAHVAAQCGLLELPPPPSSTITQDAVDSPLRQAVAAAATAASGSSAAGPAVDAGSGLWLFCLTRTAAHELGHCFGMDHCVYYACLMQGTASVAEDGRQPPYLCPVCAGKLARAAGEARRAGAGGGGFDEAAWARDAAGAMATFCARWQHVGAWAGYEAWLAARLRIEAAS